MWPTLALCQVESINESLNEVSFLLDGEKETMSKDFLIFFFFSGFFFYSTSICPFGT